MLECDVKTRNIATWILLTRTSVKAATCKQCKTEGKFFKLNNYNKNNIMPPNCSICCLSSVTPSGQFIYKKNPNASASQRIYRSAFRATEESTIGNFFKADGWQLSSPSSPLPPPPTWNLKSFLKTSRLGLYATQGTGRARLKMSQEPAPVSITEGLTKSCPGAREGPWPVWDRAGHFRYFLILSIIIFLRFIKLIIYFCTNPI